MVDRYVRVACPARGTRLLSSNFDVFLSGLSALVSIALPGQPIVAALKRIVLEVARNRTDPLLVPGIEAMLPESPMGRLLGLAKAKPIEMAVIAGDIEGGGLLKRLGVLFTDHIFFNAVDNDLVVDSDSMIAGIARAGIRARHVRSGPRRQSLPLLHQRADARAAVPMAHRAGQRLDRGFRRPRRGSDGHRRKRRGSKRSLARHGVGHASHRRRAARHHGLLSDGERRRSRLVRLFRPRFGRAREDSLGKRSMSLRKSCFRGSTATSANFFRLRTGSRPLRTTGGSRSTISPRRSRRSSARCWMPTRRRPRPFAFSRTAWVASSRAP